MSSLQYETKTDDPRLQQKNSTDTTQVFRYLRSSLEAVKLPPNLRVSPLLVCTVAAAGMQQLLPYMLYITLSHMYVRTCKHVQHSNWSNGNSTSLC